MKPADLLKSAVQHFQLSEDKEFNIYEVEFDLLSIHFFKKKGREPYCHPRYRFENRPPIFSKWIYCNHSATSIGRKFEFEVKRIELSHFPTGFQKLKCTTSLSWIKLNLSYFQRMVQFPYNP